MKHIVWIVAFAILALGLPPPVVRGEATSSAVLEFTPKDEQLLDEIERAAFLFFWNEADPESGLIPDKVGVPVCSVASMGFGLAALPIGVDRGWVTREQAEERALKALRTLSRSKARHAGIFRHYIDMKTGQATQLGYESAASTIDTALLCGGLLTVGAHFGGEAQQVADKIFAGMNWKAYVKPENGQVYMAWTPDDPQSMEGNGHFEAQTWDYYTDEALLISVIGLAAPREEFRLDAANLTSWKRERGGLGELEYVKSWPGTLFTYTFAQCFLDFRTVGADAGGVDWFFNTAMAVRANRDWCRAHANSFMTYGRDRWGITACSAPEGYVVPGHQPRGESGDSPCGGTLAPYGAGMTVPFAPDDAVAALRHMRDLFCGTQPVWRGGKHYGFADAFNLEKNWVSTETLGIAHGPMLLCIENARTGLVWRTFHAHPAVQAAIERAGLKPRKSYPQLSGTDRKYLVDVARETWDCIAHFVEPNTGLPYDTNERKDHSSVTNLGLYSASCAIAAKLGYVSEDDATSRVRRVLDGYEMFKKWKGFSQSWNSVHDFTPAAHDTAISVLDSANMVAGFALASQALPQVHDQAERILDAMDWSAFYDPEKQQVIGGYNMAKGELSRGWLLSDFASDGRLAVFWAIASGGAPPGAWEKLNRSSSEHFGLKVYRPGWMGGGLFMQAISGIFLDERSTLLGRSTSNFAYAQMLYAKKLGLPAWGWSACWSPDKRYLGWGGLEVPVVTPHAAGMAAMYYPQKAVECLKTLEGLGARAPWKENGKEYRFGFRDSVNLTSGTVADTYIPPLDQALMFLSIANVLEPEIVHRLMREHAYVRRARQLLDEYQWPEDAGWLAELERRDREPLALPQEEASSGPERVVVDDFESSDSAERTRLGGKVSAWMKAPPDPQASVMISRDTDAQGACLRINYDVDSPNEAFGGVRIELAGANVSGCDMLRIRVMGPPDKVKIELHGRGGIGATRLTGVADGEWRTINIPLIQFGGMITDWADMQAMVLVFEDHTSRPKSGTMRLDDIELVRTRK